MPGLCSENISKKHCHYTDNRVASSTVVCACFFHCLSIRRKTREATVNSRLFNKPSCLNMLHSKGSAKANFFHREEFWETV